jgi:hypothetical protein
VGFRDKMFGGLPLVSTTGPSHNIKLTASGIAVVKPHPGDWSLLAG